MKVVTERSTLFAVLTRFRSVKGTISNVAKGSQKERNMVSM